MRVHRHQILQEPQHILVLIVSFLARLPVMHFSAANNVVCANTYVVVCGMPEATSQVRTRAVSGLIPRFPYSLSINRPRNHRFVKESKKRRSACLTRLISRGKKTPHLQKIALELLCVFFEESTDERKNLSKYFSLSSYLTFSIRAFNGEASWQYPAQIGWAKRVPAKAA